MKLAFVFVVAASFFTEHLALPVGKEGQREDVVTRCLVEVLSKALSKPDSHPLDQECKDILKAGVKHAPLEKKSGEEVLTHEEEVKGHGEKPAAKGVDVKDIEALLKAVEEKRDTPEDERSQESWGLDDEKDKRSNWRPGRHHQRKHKRDEDEADTERSQESWGLDEEKEKRSEEEEEDAREKKNWRPGRYHQRRQRKRDEELSEEQRDEPEEERSQESWGLDEERDKRGWRPGRHHQRKHKRDEEPAEEEEDNERSQESWGLDEERDKRGWRPGRHHQRKHKRDEEPAEEEEDNDRSQESWGLDYERDKRGWRPGRHHQRKHKRDEELSEEVREEPEEERSQESWSLDKRHGKEEEEDREREEAMRYLAAKRNEVLGEGEELEKRNPWIYRSYYHPAWFKRNTEGHTAASHKEKELDSLAAMDMELQKIAAKLHENRNE